MKKIILSLLLFPILVYGQENERKELGSSEVRKGWYAGLTTNMTSQFEETFHSKFFAGYHFDGFHIGLHYLNSLGESEGVSDHPLINPTVPEALDVRYEGFGLDLMYDIAVVERFSVAPYINLGLVDLDYRYNKENIESENFLNTQIGAKLYFVPVKNFRIGLNAGYGLPSGADFDLIGDDNLDGLNFGITLQYNHFFPKW